MGDVKLLLPKGDFKNLKIELRGDGRSSTTDMLYAPPVLLLRSPFPGPLGGPPIAPSPPSAATPSPTYSSGSSYAEDTVTADLNAVEYSPEISSVPFQES